MSFLRMIENWRVLRILKKQPLPYSSWKLTGQIPCLDRLSAVEMAHLRVLTSVFLYQKSLTGTKGLNLTHEMKVIIAAQACLPVLKLGLNYYADFNQLVVYPNVFWTEHDVRDEAGVVHHIHSLNSGESWTRGPVILSWEDIESDIQQGDAGHNVIIHEFAHKIDMLNQTANGVPPIPVTMDRSEWRRVFSTAYKTLSERIKHHHKPCVNEYAATSPAEFFAVSSEYFFTKPQQLDEKCHLVYQELSQFYQQEPLLRSQRDNHN